MSMWEPFTRSARRSIVIAQELAQELGAAFIDGEHIFAALVREGDNGAAHAVASLGVSDRQVHEALQGSREPSGSAKGREILFSPRAKHLIELAFLEARDLQNDFVDAEHLMLAYSRESKEAQAFLSSLGIDAQALRAAILGNLAPGPRAAPAGSLDGFFASARTPLDGAELWRRLQSAVEFEDPGAALLHAILIAKQSGLTADQAAQRLQKMLEEG